MQRSIISIHAPVKGATGAEGQGEGCPRISIHAPVKGATHSDPYDVDYSQISIHAPVKGATRRRSPGGSFAFDFNPRSREGSDPTTKSPLLKDWLFQSTLP